jgi:hypothetical protein
VPDESRKKSVSPVVENEADWEDDDEDVEYQSSPENAPPKPTVPIFEKST